MPKQWCNKKTVGYTWQCSSRLTSLFLCKKLPETFLFFSVLFCFTLFDREQLFWHIHIVTFIISNSAIWNQLFGETYCFNEKTTEGLRQDQNQNLICELMIYEFRSPLAKGSISGTPY